MKKWKKPVVVQLSAVQLADHIRVAARSMQCPIGNFR